MTMGSGRPQQAQGSDVPTWVLLGLALIVSLIALPWVIVGFLAQRILKRWLPWRVSFLLWLALLIGGGLLLYSTYQSGLEQLMRREWADYVLSAQHNQADILHWPLHSLWSDTWSVWLRTWQGIGIMGFWFEISDQMHNDPAGEWRRNQRGRERRAHRSQQQARRRTRRPERVADIAGNAIVVGVPIKDQEQE